MLPWIRDAINTPFSSVSTARLKGPLRLTLVGPFHKRLYRADGTRLGVWNTGFQFQVFSRPVGEPIFKALPQDLSCAGLCGCPPFAVRGFSGCCLFSAGAEIRVSLYLSSPVPSAHRRARQESSTGLTVLSAVSFRISCQSQADLTVLTRMLILEF